MGESAGITHRTVGFESLDGQPLVGDVAVPGSVHAGAVVCHPHPQCGGNRFDNMVTALYDELPASGIAALRAPPLAVMSSTAPPTVPTLAITPRHDQFSPPPATEPILADWRARGTALVDFEVVEMADHFLAGRTSAVAHLTTNWLTDHL